MPSILLGTLEMEGFGTVMLDSGIWADFDMEKCCSTNMWKEMVMQNVLSGVIEGDGWDSRSRQFHVAFDSTVFMFALWTHYLSEAGCGSVVGRVGGG